jgi:hypothetical protein
VRILRAFVWLRWRVLVNALERTGARDAIDRLSLAVENLGPIIALLLLVPSALGMTVLGAAAGFGLATGSWQLPFEVLRYLLLAALAFSVVGPIVLPSGDAGNPTRYLLLPVPRTLLYLAHLVGALADPWILLSLPAVIGVAIGMLAGAHAVAGVIAFAAGLAFVAVLGGVSSLTSSVVHLLLRNRRRGEIVMLLLVLILPLIGLVPSVMRAEHRRGRARGHVERTVHTPTEFERVTARVASYVPSELYRQANTAAIAQTSTAAPPLTLLVLIAAALQVLGYAAFSRVLDMPQTLGVRRGAAFGGLWGRRIPGMTAGASAVALTQLRLALRSTRGRSVLMSPIMILAVFGTLIYRRGGMPFAGFNVNDGLTLGSFASFIALLAILPFAANQFAIDRAGFTRQMLSPLGIGELLAGKAVGNALICAGPAIVCVAISAAVFPGGHPALWLALPLAWLATYLLVAPVAAALSAIFPREVDLSRIGNGSNAHQAAGLLGMLTLVTSGTPSLLLVLFATRWLHRPALAPLFMFGWCLVALAICWALFVPVRKLVARRCETLAQYY